MAAGKAAASEKQPVSIPPAAIVIAVVLVLGLGGFWYLSQAAHRPAPPPPPLTGPAKAYVKYLQLSDVDKSANVNYMKQMVFEITGKIKNTGDRVLDTVEINCIFYDPYGRVVLRQRVPIVSRKMGKLAPGETKPFRLAFDNIPESWNRDMPQMVIAGMEFD